MTTHFAQHPAGGAGPSFVADHRAWRAVARAPRRRSAALLAGTALVAVAAALPAAADYTIDGGNLVTILGDGSGTFASSWNPGGTIYVGATAAGTVTVSGSGSGAAVSTATYIGQDGTGTATVSGAGTLWTVTDQFYIGFSPGSTGSLTIADGAVLSTDYATIGLNDASTLTLATGGTFSSTIASNIGGNAGGASLLNIGAAAGAAPVAPGIVDAPSIGLGSNGGTGMIVLNHTATDYTLTQPISGSGTVVSYAGTTTLSGLNTGGVALDILGGTLIVGNRAGAVTIDGTGTFKDNGTLAALTVGSGGTLAPGNSIGTTYVDGTTTFAAGSTYQVEVNDTGRSDLVSRSRARSP